ncbi:unnamed protein product [Phytophthora fragariaefolia]|uniref:Unnamed protein product n=1 Tax=Phytophthora fragariaefolia TaxID=1490495 RepID=A0A9W6YEE0_9STRA|nr:unnamed protein product [Phytophthora fragariaefolia]
MTQEFEGPTKLFRKLWAKLTAAGWKARKPSGLSDDDIYVRPGVSGRLKLLQRGVDYFVGTSNSGEKFVSIGTQVAATELTSRVRVVPEATELSRPAVLEATELPSRARAVPEATELSNRARAVPEATELSNRARDVPEATELVDLETGHYDTLEDFDDGAFLDAMRREVLFGSTESDDVNLCRSGSVAEHLSDDEDEDGALTSGDEDEASGYDSSDSSSEEDEPEPTFRDNGDGFTRADRPRVDGL